MYQLGYYSSWSRLTKIAARIGYNSQFENGVVIRNHVYYSVVFMPSRTLNKEQITYLREYYNWKPQIIYSRNNIEEYEYLYHDYSSDSDVITEDEDEDEEPMET